jgi:plasmid stabilization system protein ParE
LNSTRIEFSRKASADLERIVDHLEQHKVADIASRIKEILQSINVLQFNPFIGRPANSGHRELIIGTGVRGYIALYRYVSDMDTIFILAVRTQREAGYH